MVTARSADPHCDGGRLAGRRSVGVENCRRARRATASSGHGVLINNGGFNGFGDARAALVVFPGLYCTCHPRLQRIISLGTANYPPPDLHSNPHPSAKRNAANLLENTLS